MAIHAALLLSLLESLALAGVLLHWADRVAGARLLVGFLLGVSVWIVGNELPSWTGEIAERPALMLLATAALTSAVFLHFALAVCGHRVPRAGLAAIYGTGSAAAAVSIVLPAGSFEPFAGVALMAVPNAAGLLTSVAWAVLAALGQMVLLRGLLRSRGIERRQLAALMASSAWGLFCMSGYGIAALHLPLYPWPLLGLPLYPLILVYGVLRYRVLVANAWARRALVWALLVGLAGLVAGAAGALASVLPVANSAWASGAAAAAAVLLLGGPVRRLAERAIYPGRTVSAEDLRAWRRLLSATDSHAALWREATSLLTRCVNLAVRVDQCGEAQDGMAQDGVPLLRIQRDAAGWTCRLVGWNAAPPGPRRLAGLFADVLVEQAVRVDGIEASRGQERERQHRERLAELGALAATVAHDVRNPLNTISMAVAMLDADTRREVDEQVRRVSRLADDLLDYARPWRVESVPLDPAEAAASVLTRHRTAGCDDCVRSDGSRVLADPHQFGRVLDNLVENTRLPGVSRLAIEIEGGGSVVRIHVCDDGPGIPDGLRDRLFQPFVSRRAGGTGLGLAIVSRIMQAHDGTVALTNRPGWTTCFTLTLPGVP